MKFGRKLVFIAIVLLHLHCSKDDEGTSAPEPSSPAIAEFDALATTIRAGTRVQFVNRSANATSYQWSFAGGTPDSSTEVEPFIQYLNPGTYDVTLTAINSEGDDTQTRENFITVIDPNSVQGTSN